MTIRRLKGRMIRHHYRTMRGCACDAWCEGYNECSDDYLERKRLEETSPRLQTLADTIQGPMGSF